LSAVVETILEQTGVGGLGAVLIAPR
jgi:hypothetical protein